MYPKAMLLGSGPSYAGDEAVDNVIDIDRLYSQEFSDYLQKGTIGNPRLRRYNTLMLAAGTLIHTAQGERPYINLTLCGSDGLVLLETINKAKIGRVCYLALCKKLVFLSQLQQGKPVCTKITGTQLLSEAKTECAYVVAYPIQQGDGSFIGYLTGATDHEECLAECTAMVSLLARLITDYNDVFEKQIALRSAVMNNVRGCAIMMHSSGDILESNTALSRFVKEQGQDPQTLNLLQLLVDRESFITNTLRQKSSGQNEMTTEFKLQLGHNIYACNLTQCEPLPIAYGETGYFLCFDILKCVVRAEGKYLRSDAMQAHFGHLYSKHQEYNEILVLCEQVAPKKINILIQGESGTGKEVLARAIHAASLVTGPFVAMNCGAIAPNLLLSELFGYEDGAFTGASRGGKIGKLELAHNGTLFLDEIGEMPLESQVSLLKFLDNQVVVRVGGTKQYPVSVRIIAATNRNLAAEVRDGNFREDLFYRLNVLDFQIPPVRERKEDIPGICNNILMDLAEKHQATPLQLDSNCQWLLRQYDWPGNVRELKNILELASALTEDNRITLPLLQRIMDQKCFRSSAAAKTLPFSERELVKLALEHHDWKITAAAAELKMSRTTLYKKIEKYKLVPEASF